MVQMDFHPLKSLSTSKDVEAQFFLSKDGQIEGKIHGLITVVAMTVASLSFVALFCVPMGLQREMGHAAAEAAMESFQFRVFVVMDAVSFFCGMGVVALLLLLGGGSEGATIDPLMVVVCRRVTHLAMGCEGIAFLAAVLTFTTRHP